MSCEAVARREARIEVLNGYFNELVTSIQSDVLFITNECLARKLITPTIQVSISNSPATPGEKATKLLTAIRECMEHQEDCCNKFLTVLKKRLIFDDLIEKIKSSLEETINRKVTAECTDRSHSVRQPKQVKAPHNLPKEQDVFNLPNTSSRMGVMTARQVVIKRHMSQLKSSMQHFIAPIASQCQTKGLISKETYQSVMKTKKTVKQRTKFLLVNVCNSVRADGEKFDVFIEILEKRQSCKDLALTIKNDIKAMREVKKVKKVTATLSSQSELVLSNQRQQELVETVSTASTLHLRRRERSTELSCVHAAESHGPITVSGEDVDHEVNHNVLLGSQTVSANKIHSSGLSPQREREYNLSMEKKQNEAKLEDLKKKEQASKAKKEKLQNCVAELEDMVREKDQVIEDLTVNRDNLKLALESLRVKISYTEKEHHDSEQKRTEALLNKIKELENQIAKLQEEKGALQKKVNDLTEQVNNLTSEVQVLRLSLEQQAASLEDALKTDLKCNQENLKKSFKENLRCTEERLSRSTFPLQIALAAFVVIVGVSVLVWIYYHW